VLRGLEGRSDGRLLVGPREFDDAGVFELGESEGLPAGTRVALVQTLDFFPPVVDDPTLYGAIAAANSISDVYAMGGRPLSCLTLASLPKEFPDEWVQAIFKGGFDKIAEAGAVVVGGHTVEAEIQFGFSVTGVVEREQLTTNAGARPGDQLYLTKPIGMGTMTTSAKLGKIEWATLEPAALQMATLNRAACEAMIAVRARAATDVTGFGLVGHARNMARGSALTLRIESSQVPLFPGVRELARKGWLSGGAKRSRAGLAEEVRVAPELDEDLINLLFDAETSGGLLIAVPAERCADLERELEARALPVRRVGECLAQGDVAIEVV
jgi:selenide,water dikinase